MLKLSVCVFVVHGQESHAFFCLLCVLKQQYVVFEMYVTSSLLARKDKVGFTVISSLTVEHALEEGQVYRNTKAALHYNRYVIQ